MATHCEENDYDELETRGEDTPGITSSKEAEFTRNTGGLDYQFVGDVPEDLYCGICTKVMDTPHLTDCCGQHYCRYCLSHWMTTSTGHNCPYCREESSNHIHDKHFDRSIKELEIKCSNLTHGCNWTGPLMNQSAHLDSESGKGCQFHVVACVLNCGEMYERRLIAEHVYSQCKLRNVSCENCGMVLKKNMLQQHLSLCDHVPVPCPKSCGRMIKRWDLDRHVSVDCDERQVQCLFGDLGCEDVVKQCELEEHVQKCKDKHMVKAYARMVSGMQKLTLEVEGLRSERTPLLSKMDYLQTGLTTCQKNTEALKQRNMQLKSVILNELEFLHVSCKPCGGLSMECMWTGLENQVVYLNPAGNPATFRMMDYLAHKVSGQVWYSPSFYIGKGYRFCLSFHLNGTGMGKGTHVTVYLHQMAGQFDADITWPFFFEQDLEICLMWQEPPKDFKMASNKNGPRNAAVRKPNSRSCSNCPSNNIPEGAPPGDFRKRSKSVLCRESQATPRVRSSVSSVYVAECQVMGICKTLRHPLESTCSVSQTVAKLELFCLQKVFNSIVFLDSMVLQCQLMREDGSHVPPAGLDDIGWTASSPPHPL